MITKLKVKNWKSHETTELAFCSGTNALLGIMGSGKTSLIQAVSFALFGDLPELRHKQITLDDLIMRKPTSKRQASVSLDFTFSGKNYSVLRVIEKGSGTTKAELREEGKLIATQPKKVTEEIVSLLKADYELFEKAVYARQNDIDFFLTLSAPERKRKMDSLLNLDKIESARSGLNSIIRDYSTRISEKSSSIKSLNVVELDAKIKDTREKIEKQLKTEKQVATARETLSLELSNTKTFLEKLEKKSKDAQELALSIKGLNSKAELLEKQLSALKKIPELNKDTLTKARFLLAEAMEAEQLISKLSAQIGTLEGKIEELSARNSSLPRSDPSELEKKLTESEQELKSLPEKKNQLQSAQAKLASAKTLLSQELERLDAIGGDGPCPTCETPLTEKKRAELRGAVTSHISSLKSEISSSPVKQLSDELEKLGLLKERISSLKLEIEKSREHKNNLERISELKKKISTLNKEQEKLSQSASKRQELETQIQLSKKSEEKSILQNELSSLLAEISSKQKKLTSLSFSQDTLSVMRNKFTQLSSDLAAVEAEISHLPEMRKQNEQLLETLRADKKKHDETLNSLSRLESVKSDLQLLQNALKSVQHDLRETFVQRINNDLSILWSQLYPYGDFSGVRLSVTNRGDYDLELHDRSGWRSVDGLASGGERSLACLALRIAFARVLAPNLRWLILDEPTHNLDSNGIEELANALRERIPSIIDQIILITHEEQLEKSVTGYCYRLVRDKGNDSPTLTEVLVDAG